MKKLSRKKIGGLSEKFLNFSKKVSDFTLTRDNASGFSALLLGCMKELDFDRVTQDKAGNVIGEISGFAHKKDVVLISHMDLPASTVPLDLSSRLLTFKSGIISSIYAAALVKRTLLPLQGNLMVCCLPRTACYGAGIKHLFEEVLKSRIKKLKGVILCEPTDFNINLGHKGRMEYEIVVKGALDNSFLASHGVNMLGAMFPLIHELENVSRSLPTDYTLGASSLRIKDVSYGSYEHLQKKGEFRVIVDREFVPEETESFILNKANTIAKNIYKSQTGVSVNTTLAKQRFTTHTGLDVVSEKELKPWIMEGGHPFVEEALSALRENGFKSQRGFWKNILTEGSYTHGALGIPTIGFGAGCEAAVGSGNETLTMTGIEKAALGLQAIVARSIGMPSFGWTSDEI